MSWNCWSQNGLLLYAGGRVKNEHPVNTLHSTGPARELSRERITSVLVISWVSDPIPLSYYAVACAMERGGGVGESCLASAQMSSMRWACEDMRELPIIADKILEPNFFLFPWVPLRRASNFCSNVFLILFPCCESLRWKIWQYCFAVRKTGKNMHFNLKQFPAHLFLGHVRFWPTRSPWQQRRRYKVDFLFYNRFFFFLSPTGELCCNRKKCL